MSIGTLDPQYDPYFVFDSFHNGWNCAWLIVILDILCRTCKENSKDSHETIVFKDSSEAHSFCMLNLSASIVGFYLHVS